MAEIERLQVYRKTDFSFESIKVGNELYVATITMISDNGVEVTRNFKNYVLNSEYHKRIKTGLTSGKTIKLPDYYTPHSNYDDSIKFSSARNLIAMVESNTYAGVIYPIGKEFQNHITKCQYNFMSELREIDLDTDLFCLIGSSVLFEQPIEVPEVTKYFIEVLQKDATHKNADRVLVNKKGELAPFAIDIMITDVPNLSTELMIEHSDPEKMLRALAQHFDVYAVRDFSKKIDSSDSTDDLKAKNCLMRFNEEYLNKKTFSIAEVFNHLNSIYNSGWQWRDGRRYPEDHKYKHVGICVTIDLPWDLVNRYSKKKNMFEAIITNIKSFA